MSLESTHTTCKNCQTIFEGKFCPNCAQKADTHRFTVGHFAHEFFHAFTHTDKGIFFLSKELLLRPGKVAREYNSGMRKKYFNPITFLLIVTAIQIFVIKKTEFFTAFNQSLKTLTEQAAQSSAESRKQLDQSLKNADKQTSRVTENNKAFTLLIIPVLSLMTWILFKKSGQNYAENLVFNVLLMSGMTLIFFIIVIPFLILPSFVILWMLLDYIAIWIYTIIAYKQFYNQRWPVTIAKGVLMQIVIMISSFLVAALMEKMF
ncbi:MAG TPA: DUF3667 domain-containing protein [Cyclobacteriaceae bacterium]